MSFYNKFIGLKELPKEARSIIRNYSFIKNLVSFSFSLTSTFYILYIIDTIGFREAGIITAISIFVQLLIDYPSGSLGDLIGQKWVFTMALIGYSISFYLMSVAYVFTDFVIAAILFGFSNAQSSGALESWLDNSYKSIKDNPDTDRKNYGYSMNKINAISSLIMGMSFMISWSDMPPSFVNVVITGTVDGDGFARVHSWDTKIEGSGTDVTVYTLTATQVAEYESTISVFLNNADQGSAEDLWEPVCVEELITVVSNGTTIFTVKKETKTGPSNLTFILSILATFTLMIKLKRKID